MEPEEVREKMHEMIEDMRDSGAITGLITCAWADDEKQEISVMGVGSDMIDCVSADEMNISDLVHGLQLLHKGHPKLAHEILNGTWLQVDTALNQYIAENKERMN